MKKWKQMLSLALSVAMIGTTIAVPSFADEQGWKFDAENGKWFYIDGAGNRAMNGTKSIHGQWYGFDKDGWMYDNEVFVHPKDEGKENPRKHFAKPLGELAEGWRSLNKEGKTYDKYKDDSIVWYFFAKPTGEDPAEMVIGKEIKEGKQTYAVDEEGIMYSREWASVDSEGNTYSEGEVNIPASARSSYYQFNGPRAEDKWLPIENAWYYFDGDGVVKEEVSKTIASSSNASSSDAERMPYREVEEIVLAQGQNAEVEVAAGNEVTMQFQVNLASDSNAKSQEFSEDGHDIWLSRKATGEASLEDKFSIEIINTDTGLCSVTYTPQRMLEDEELYLFVDGIASEAITLMPEAPNSENIGNTIDSIVGNEDSAQAAEDLKVVYGAINENENVDAKDIFQQQILGADDNNKEIAAAYEKIDSDYETTNNITKVVTVNEEAKATLGEGTVSVVGAALNAEKENEKVELIVASGDAEASENAQNYTLKVAFDITFKVGGEPQTELKLPVKISMPIPVGFAKDDLRLFHVHGEDETEIKNFAINGDTIEFITDKFSTYVFAQGEKTQEPENPDTPDPEEPENPDTPDPEEPENPDDGGNTGGSSSSSGGSRRDSNAFKSTVVTGQWIQDAVGWWYRNPDGSYPVNTWMQLEYNHVTDWYHFNKDGYMDTGWFTDVDGHIYYLNPISNGFRGAMLTGWQVIDGYSYYFNTVSNGFKGMLLTNTTTPDNYQVNEKGQKVE